MTREAPHPMAVRRRIARWLQDAEDKPVLALDASPDWPDDPQIAIDGQTVRIVGCRTPLAARDALHERRVGERLVLLTELSGDQLGDGILTHVSGCRVRSIDRWNLVRQMFGCEELDPTIVSSRYGGGGWLADALTVHEPVGRWLPPPGSTLTRDHAMRCLAAVLLGLDGDRLDAAGLLQWSIDAPAVLRFAALPEAVIDGITGFLAEEIGPVAVPVMRAVKAGHGADVVAFGLLVPALWPDGAGRAATESVVARTRLEPRFGNTPITDGQAAALCAAAEAWVDRASDPDDRGDAYRLLARAERIAVEIGATDLLIASNLLPAAFSQRLRAFGAELRAAVPAGPAAPPDTTAVVRVHHELACLDRHRGAATDQVGDRATAHMAVRLLRWLATPDAGAPPTLLDAVHRYVRDDGWVDRARLDVFAGATEPIVAAAYSALHLAVDARRARHDKQFAAALAAATAANADPGALIRVEDVLDRVVQPILRNGRRVLLLILDGMSVAASTELAESLTRPGIWAEMTPGGGPRTGVLAALPTITEVSRYNLLSGRVGIGGQREERAAFESRYPKGRLLHKSDLRARAGQALDGEVVAAVEDAFVPLVAAVVNTIDDALDRSDPGTVVWSEDTIVAVRDLLKLATDRVVVLVSDHGHVVDRGTDGVVYPSPSSENRWRPATPGPAEGEVLVTGDRVAKGGGSVVLPWREDIRYGPRKAGYHGGASPAEVVIPLIVLANRDDEHAVPGWSGAPVASPAWWREAPAAEGPPAAPVRPNKSTAGRRGPTQSAQAGPSLFDEAAEVAAPAAAAAARPPLVEALLASPVYQQRRGGRGELPEERVVGLLTVLLAGDGRATMDSLAAGAGIPAHRIAGTVTALRKLLSVEGYPVIEVNADGQTVLLDRALLAEQFGLKWP